MTSESKQQTSELLSVHLETGNYNENIEGNSVGQNANTIVNNFNHHHKSQEANLSEEGLVVVISGNLDNISSKDLDLILTALQQLTGDCTLKMEFVKKGSVKIGLSGSQEALKKIQKLFEEGEIKEILGHHVLDVKSVNLNDELNQNIYEFDFNKNPHTNLHEIIPLDEAGSNQKQVELNNIAATESTNEPHLGNLATRIAIAVFIGAISFPINLIEMILPSPQKDSPREYDDYK